DLLLGVARKLAVFLARVVDLRHRGVALDLAADRATLVLTAAGAGHEEFLAVAHEQRLLVGRAGAGVLLVALFALFRLGTFARDSFGVLDAALGRFAGHLQFPFVVLADEPLLVVIARA